MRLLNQSASALNNRPSAKLWSVAATCCSAHQPTRSSFTKLSQGAIVASFRGLSKLQATPHKARARLLALKPKEVLGLLGAALLSLLQVGKHVVRFLPRLARQARPSGPAGVVLVLVGLIGAGIATLRQKIVTNVRACKACSGYGIQRCTLCAGRGMVGWEGKWSHREPCPMCLGRRFVDCTACGGKFHRPLFQHIQTTATSLLEEIKQAEALQSRISLAD